MRAFALALALVAALSPTSAGAHNSSRVKSHFAVQESGQVLIELALTEQDLLDLVNIDLSSPREAEEARAGLLGGRLATSVPRWLRLLGDGEACPVRYDAWEAPSPGAVHIKASAACGGLPEVLTIHWGLSALSTLELIALTRITAPAGIEHATVLSRRTPKAEVIVKRPGALETFGRFFASGVEHILLGWDHLAFLLALLLACARASRLFLVATAFTLAHSVTLALGATGALEVRPEIVEPIIAASIAVAAAAALVRLFAGSLAFPGSGRQQQSAAWELSLVAAFGLVHGLGFATLLQAALGKGHGVVTALLAFNLGVEVGQVASLAVAFPLLALLGKRLAAAPRVFAALLFSLVLLGSYVAVARALAG